MTSRTDVTPTLSAFLVSVRGEADGVGGVLFGGVCMCEGLAGFILLSTLRLVTRTHSISLLFDSGAVLIRREESRSGTYCTVQYSVGATSDYFV